MLYALSLAQIKELARNAAEEILAEWKKEKDNEGNELVTCDQAYALLSKTRPTLWRWDKTGYLKPVRVGAANMYRRSDIDAILKSKGLK